MSNSNNKNFINFHILISHSPSCLNRDDMNMQKSATFGGVRRVRISSQSLKRAIRTSDYYQQHLGQPSQRTRELGRLNTRYTEALKEQFSAEQVTQAIEWIAGKQGIADDPALQASSVAPWSVAEVAYYCQVIADAGDDVDQKKLEKQISKAAAPFNEALTQAVDIALSGRMATSGLMTNMDGALAVAHAITTHAVDADIDWFTAVDDLVAEEQQKRRVGETTEGEGQQGSGHLGTQEFSSGVFYRYASLNIAQLQKNLGDAPREKALDIAAHVLHMLATVVPSAKQQTSAAFNLADYALVSFSSIPISLANAFENPVKNQKQGFLKPSINTLQDYWQQVHQGYGLEEQVAIFQLAKRDAMEGQEQFSSLTALTAWVKDHAGEDG